MNSLHFIYIFLQISNEILSATIKEPSEENPELSEGLYQGDIQHPPIELRNGILIPISRWPNAIVYYKFVENQFDLHQRNHIEHAMRFISQHSCIKFQLAPENATYYLRISSDEPGCQVEYLGWRHQVQNLNLQRHSIGNGCFRIGSILHELLHVLGFQHQHVVPNRDKYIHVVWKNIKPKYRINFKNNHKTHQDDFREEYDYNSVMHYSRIAFSIDPKKLWTLLPIQRGGDYIGQRKIMSKMDIIKLNRMYKCPGHV